jgi:hypothetical protein
LLSFSTLNEAHAELTVILTTLCCGSKYITSNSVICSKQTAFQVSPLSATLHFFYFVPMNLQALKAMLEMPVTFLFVSIDENLGEF